MAYPEPIPELRGRNAKEFIERFERFRLTSSQEEFYREARQFYLRHKPKD